IDMRDVLARRETKEAELKQNPNINIVVLNAEGDLYGLIVDEVLDTADIVVKPLSKFLKSLEVYSAATILGSGKVALIIDPMGLAKAGGVMFEKKQTETDYLRSTSAKENSDAQEFLLFRTKAAGKYAIPLCMVNRLEEFARDAVEYSGEQMVMRYRDSILPLLDVSDILGFGATGTGVSRTLPTIVVSQRGRAYGIVVEEILDVTDCDSMIDDSIRDRFGLLGNVVIGNEIINVIDALSIIDKESGRMGGDTLKAQIGSQIDTAVVVQRRVLFAEDVAFFRRQTAKILMGQGYEVFAVEDGKKALDLLTAKEAGYFDLILSDIEMPVMNGMNFARNARQTEQGKGVPMIALTTRFKQSDIDEGMSAGFDTYLEKLNPEVLIKSIDALFAAKKG
ncbi:MAG: response regulator, partial [Proteobacteria bacterium]